MFYKECEFRNSHYVIFSILLLHPVSKVYSVFIHTEFRLVTILEGEERGSIPYEAESKMMNGIIYFKL
jgi:hypothetical protein